MTATARPPAKPADTPPPAPRFPVGFPVSLGYMGLAEAGKPACYRDGSDTTVNNARVVAVRLAHEWEEREIPGTEGETAFVITYPKGWEYLLQIGDRDPHGWYAEAELTAKGYAPAAPVPTECDTGWLEERGFAWADETALVRKLFGSWELIARVREVGRHGNSPEVSSLSLGLTRREDGRPSCDYRLWLYDDPSREDVAAALKLFAGEPDPAPIACTICAQLVPQLDGRQAGDGQQLDGKAVCPGCARTLREKAAELTAAALATFPDLAGVLPVRPAVVPLAVPTDDELARGRAVPMPADRDIAEAVRDQADDDEPEEPTDIYDVIGGSHDSDDPHRPELGEAGA